MAPLDMAPPGTAHTWHPTWSLSRDLVLHLVLQSVRAVLGGFSAGLNTALGSGAQAVMAYVACHLTLYCTCRLQIVRAVLGGFSVGLGAALGNGCTSGHGVCGCARLNLRSLVFMCVSKASYAVSHQLHKQSRSVWLRPPQLAESGVNVRTQGAICSIS